MLISTETTMALHKARRQDELATIRLRQRRVRRMRAGRRVLPPSPVLAR